MMGKTSHSSEMVRGSRDFEPQSTCTCATPVNRTDDSANRPHGDLTDPRTVATMRMFLEPILIQMQGCESREGASASYTAGRSEDDDVNDSPQ